MKKYFSERFLKKEKANQTGGGVLDQYLFLFPIIGHLTHRSHWLLVWRDSATSNHHHRLTWGDLGNSNPIGQVDA